MISRQPGNSKSSKRNTKLGSLQGTRHNSNVRARTGLSRTRLETNSPRELETAGTNAGRHRYWRAERRIRCCGPKGQPVSRRISRLGRSVLDIIDAILLEVRMVQQIESFGKNFEREAFAKLERTRHTGVDDFLTRPSESIERLARHHGKVHRRSIEHCGVRSAAG